MLETTSWSDATRACLQISAAAQCALTPCFEAEASEFASAADAYELSANERASAWLAYSAFRDNSFGENTDVVVFGRNSAVEYARPFVGPGNITPRVIAALSMSTNASLGREVGYYRVTCSTCEGGHQFLLRLLGTTGGADPPTAVEMIGHNHPSGTRRLSRWGEAAAPDCAILCRGGELHDQQRTVLAYGHNSGLLSFKPDTKDELIPSGYSARTGHYDIIPFRSYCSCP